MTITFSSESITVWVCCDFDQLPFDVLRAIYNSHHLTDLGSRVIWN